MLWTTVGFLASTGVFVAIYLARSKKRSQQRAEMCGAPCPRCRKSVPQGAGVCPACGVPMQAFDIVGAPLAVEEAGALQGSEAPRPHAVVRADQCVGCAGCVPVCPEAGALRLEGKIAIVDRARCAGHGRCVEACPVGAIFLATGDAVHRIEVPSVGPDFQTNVPGVYLVGELGGRGLIKNAVNEGRIAVEAIARDLASRPPRGTEVAEVLDVVIAGSGPAGLSAGLEAHRRGLRYAILEQGSVADSIRKYPRHKILLAEPVNIPIYGELWVSDASKETLLKVWEAIIASTGLSIVTECAVEDVQRDGDVLRVMVGGGRVYRAHRVVLALGRRGTPRRLGVKGEELDKVFYNIVEMEAFEGQKVLVVGGGDSAIESALGLANQPGTTVTLSYRGATFNRVKERNQAKFDEAIRSGRVQVLLNSEVREIAPDSVWVETEGRALELPNDVVIVRIGGEAPTRFLERVGVKMVRKELSAGGLGDAAAA